jgi:hypothetical protein
MKTGFEKHIKITGYFVKYLLFVLLFFIVDFSISYFLANGLNKYYGLNTASKILCIGHSHTMLGLDKNMIEDKMHCKVAKYAIEGANVRDRFSMIKHFLYQNGDSVKLITYDVDPTFLTGNGISRNSYTLFYPFMDDPYIEEYIQSEKKSKFEFLLRKWIRTTRFNDLNINGSLRGQMGFFSNIKIGVIDTLALKRRIAENDYIKITFDESLQLKFEETLEYVSNKNIKLVLLLLPTIDILNNVDPENYNKAVSILEGYSHKYKNVYFFNYNDDLSHQHDLFYDSVHLNPKGSKVVTERLIEDLRSFTF